MDETDVTTLRMKILQFSLDSSETHHVREVRFQNPLSYSNGTPSNTPAGISFTVYSSGIHFGQNAHIPNVHYINIQKRPAKNVIIDITQADSIAASESDINPRSSKVIRVMLLSAKANRDIRKKRINTLCQYRFERKVHQYWPVNEMIKAVRNATRFASRASFVLMSFASRP